MIGKAVELLKDYISERLTNMPSLQNEHGINVDLSLLNEHSSVSLAKNVLYLTVVNIEEDRVVKSQSGTTYTSGGTYSHQNPAIRINFYLMISANFEDYKLGLEFLAGAIRSFQSKNVFNHQNTPQLDNEIQQLIIEMHTLGIEEQKNLWNTIGTSYLPSVLYKVKSLFIQEDTASKEGPPITTVNINSGKV